MKKYYIVVIIATLAWGCGSKGESEAKEEQKNTQENPAVAEKEKAKPKEEAKSEEEASPKEEIVKVDFIKFDWGKIPESKAKLDAYPYFTTPKGMVIGRDRVRGVSKHAYSTIWDFNMLIMHDGKGFYMAEGRRAHINYDMKDKHFDQGLFDKEIEGQLQSMGAVEIFKGQISRELLEAIDKHKKIGSNCFEHITGDVWNSTPIKHYALNHSDAKIFFQVYSNTASGEISVILQEDFVQTIKPINASVIKKEEK